MVMKSKPPVSEIIKNDILRRNQSKPTCGYEVNNFDNPDEFINNDLMTPTEEQNNYSKIIDHVNVQLANKITAERDKYSTRLGYEDKDGKKRTARVYRADYLDNQGQYLKDQKGNLKSQLMDDEQYISLARTTQAALMLIRYGDFGGNESENKKKAIEQVVTSFNRVQSDFLQQNYSSRQKATLVRQFQNVLTNNLQTDTSTLEMARDTLQTLNQQEIICTYRYLRERLYPVRDEFPQTTAQIHASMTYDNELEEGYMANFLPDDDNAYTKEGIKQHGQNGNALFWLNQLTNAGTKHTWLLNFLYYNNKQLRQVGKPLLATDRQKPFLTNYKTDETFIGEYNATHGKLPEITEYQRNSRKRVAFVNDIDQKPDKNAEDYQKNKQAVTDHRLGVTNVNMAQIFAEGIDGLSDYLARYGAMYTQAGSVNISWDCMYQTLLSPLRFNADQKYVNEKRQAFNKLINDTENREKLKGLIENRLRQQFPQEKIVRKESAGSDQKGPTYKVQHGDHDFDVTVNFNTNNYPLNFGRRFAAPERWRKLATTRSVLHHLADELEAFSQYVGQKQTEPLNNGTSARPHDDSPTVTAYVDYIRGHTSSLPEQQYKNLIALEQKLRKSETQFYGPELTQPAQRELGLKMQAARILKEQRLSRFGTLIGKHNTLRKAVLLQMCVGSRGEVITGCKSAKDRTSVYMAAVNAAYKEPDCLESDRAFKKAVVNELKTGHYHFALSDAQQAVKLGLVSPDFTKWLKETKDKDGEPLHDKNKYAASRWTDRMKADAEPPQAIQELSQQSLTPDADKVAQQNDGSKLRPSQQNEDAENYKDTVRTYIDNFKYLTTQLRGYLNAGQFNFHINDYLSQAYNRVKKGLRDVLAQTTDETKEIELDEVASDRIQNLDQGTTARLSSTPESLGPFNRVVQLKQTVFNKQKNLNKSTSKSSKDYPFSAQSRPLNQAAEIYLGQKNGKSGGKEPIRIEHMADTEFDQSQSRENKRYYIEDITYNHLSQKRHEFSLQTHGSSGWGSFEKNAQKQKIHDKQLTRNDLSEYLKNRELGQKHGLSKSAAKALDKAYQQYRQANYDYEKDHKIDLPKKHQMELAAEMVENFRQTNGENVPIHIHNGDVVDPAFIKSVAIYASICGYQYEDQSGLAPTQQMSQYIQAMVDNSEKFDELNDVFKHYGSQFSDSFQQEYIKPDNKHILPGQG